MVAPTNSLLPESRPLPNFSFLASLVAVFGEFDISSDLETKRSVTKNVKRVIVHRQYDAATFENDLAILELENPIHYDVHIGTYGPRTWYAKRYGTRQSPNQVSPERCTAPSGSR